MKHLQIAVWKEQKMRNRRQSLQECALHCVLAAKSAELAACQKVTLTRDSMFFQFDKLKAWTSALPKFFEVTRETSKMQVPRMKPPRNVSPVLVLRVLIIHKHQADDTYIY